MGCVRVAVDAQQRDGRIRLTGHLERRGDDANRRDPVRQLARQAVRHDAAVRVPHGVDAPRIDAECGFEIVDQRRDEPHVVDVLLDGETAAATTVPGADAEQGTSGAVGLVVDSSGLLAIAMDQRSAADELGIDAGDQVTLTPSQGEAPSPQPVTIRSPS